MPPAVRAWRERGRTIDVDGNDIFVLEQGSGPHTVFVLHGFQMSSFEWRDVVARLAARVRVVAFDFLGFGLSDKPVAARYSLFEQADLAERVAAALGVEHCTVVGHDMGDTVLAELLMRQAELRLTFRIERAVLTPGAIFIDIVRLRAGQKLLLLLPDRRLPFSIPRVLFRRGLRALFSKDHQPSAETLEGMIWLIRREGGDRLLPRQMRYLDERRRHQGRWTAGLVEFAGPMTAFWGEQDPNAVVGMAHRLKQLRPDTEVIAWPDVSHWLPTEVPDRLADEILRRL